MVGKKAAFWSFDIEDVQRPLARVRRQLSALGNPHWHDIGILHRAFVFETIDHIALRRRQGRAAWEGCGGGANRHRGVVMPKVSEG